MKIFIAFMLLFFTNCLAPAAISATINAKNTTLHSNAKVKKLNFSTRFLLRLWSLKSKIEIAKDAILPLTLGVIFFILGVLLLISSLGSGGILALILCLFSFSFALVFLIGGFADFFG